MDDPKDSLNIEVFGLKASAVGRFPIGVFLICFLVAAAFLAAFGPPVLQWVHPQEQITRGN